MSHVWPPDPSPARTFLLQSFQAEIDRILEGRARACAEPEGTFLHQFCTRPSGPTDIVLLQFGEFVRNPPPPGTPFPHAENSRLRLALAAIVITAATLAAGPIFGPVAGLTTAALTAQDLEDSPITNQQFQANLTREAATVGITAETTPPATGAGRAVPVALVALSLVAGFFFLG